MARTKAEPRTNGNGQTSRALTAAAERIDPSNISQAKQVGKRRADWQNAAMDLYGAEPMFAAPYNYLGNALSHVRPFAAWRPDANAEPVPLDPEDKDQQAAGLQQLAVAARNEMARIGGSIGTAGPLVGAFGLLTGLVGECYLYGADDPENPGTEKWEILSYRELQFKDKGWRIFDDENDHAGTPVDDNAYMQRIWRRDPLWRKKAYSPVKSLIETGDGLLLLERAMKVSTMARLPAGFLLIPQGLSFPQRITDPSDGQARDDPFVQDIIDAMVTPVRDPDSASALVPLIVQGPAESLKEFRHITIERPLSEEQMKLRDEARKIIGIGADIAMDLLFSAADLNHWNLFMVDDQAFKAYFEPLLLIWDAALTTGLLLPALREQFGSLLEQHNILVWHDASDLVGDPDEFPHALDMHKEGATSDAHLRRMGGASEDDAPDDAEIQRRADAKRPAAPFGQPDPQAMPTPGQPPDPMMDKPMAASARTGVSDLGRKLEEIDRNLQRRIVEWADAAVRRLLDNAASRLRVKLSRSDRKTFDRYRNRDVLGYTHEVGPEGLIAAGIEETDLLDRELADLEDRYRKATKRAFLAALALAQTATGKRISTTETEDLLVRQEPHIETGLAFLTAAIVATARTLLFNPDPQAPALGEHDALTLIPAGIVRESLAQAGGATTAAPNDETGRPSGGIATGESAMAVYERDLALTPDAYEWDYGDPASRTTTFEPHEALDGVQFLDWSDDALVNDEPWPDTQFFAPGDHDGCACGFVPVFIAERGE